MSLRAKIEQLEVQHAGLHFDIGFEGYAPVQAWGSIGAYGQRFYFRWRGRKASLTVGPAAVAQLRTAAEVWAAITWYCDSEKPGRQ